MTASAFCRSSSTRTSGRAAAPIFAIVRESVTKELTRRDQAVGLGGLPAREVAQRGFNRRPIGLLFGRKLEHAFDAGDVDARLRGFSQRKFRRLHGSGEIRRSEECRQRQSAGEKA